jgi:iron complex outermembrane receptor protein
MNARSLWNLRAALALTLGASLIPAAVAQQKPVTALNDDKGDEALKLEKFVVTGSMIPIAANTPAAPVKVLTAIDIQNTGVTSDLTDVLKKTNPSFFGRGNLGAENANTRANSTNGASTVALRNRATLVLINGRRAAVSPVAATGGGSFVDVSLIPISAVERIEVLNDGASATYGSDAVSGVVNVILKTNYRGVETGGTYSWAPDAGNHSTRQAYVIFGAGNEKTQVTMSAEWRRTDPLFQYERPWGKNQFRTPTFAGVITADGSNLYFLNPNLNAPPVNLDVPLATLVAQGIYQGPYNQDQVAQFFDLSAKATMFQKTQRFSGSAAVQHKWTDSITAFGDILITNSLTESSLNAQPVSGNVVASNQFNPTDVTIQARNRFVDFPRIRVGDSLGMRGVFGLRGSIGSWNWETAATLNRSTLALRQLNLIDTNAYNTAVTNGTYNPFARRQAAGVIEGIVGTGYQDYVSRVNSFDVRVNGELFELPAGPLQVAFGAETRTERVSMVNDRNDRLALWLQGTPTNPFAAKTAIDGFSTEFRVPVFSPKQNIPFVNTLEVGLAARKEIYTSTTDPLVPKFSVRWLPFNDEFVVRGSYGESFTAPTLFNLFGPSNSGFTGSININRFNPDGTPMIVNGTQVTTGNRQYRSRGGSNPNLVPSESRNWSAGFVWSPRKFKGLTVTADWFNIDERNLIGNVPQTTLLQSVEALGPASPYASQVRLGTSVAGESYFANGTPITAPGQITSGQSDAVWMTNPALNIAGVWQAGADVTVEYRYDTGSWGRLDASVTGTYIHEYVQQTLPTSLPGNFVDGFTGSTYPRYRTFSQLNWTYKNMTAGISHSFIPTVDDLVAATERQIDSSQTFDLRFSYRFTNSSNRLLQGLRLSAGVLNVFGEDPPYSAGESDQNRDINTYDAFGRRYVLSANYKF